MIKPILNYGITGAIWYQGESNAGRAYQYRELLPLMIEDWRNKWEYPDMPFLFVQLANFMEPAEKPGSVERLKRKPICGPGSPLSDHSELSKSSNGSCHHSVI
jgi:ribosomal protein S27AE